MHQNEVQYTCPRCDIVFYNANAYKKHCLNAHSFVPNDHSLPKDYDVRSESSDGSSDIQHNNTSSSNIQRGKSKKLFFIGSRNSSYHKKIKQGLVNKTYLGTCFRLEILGSNFKLDFYFSERTQL